MKELVYQRQLLPAVERMGDQRSVIDTGYEGTLGGHLDRSLRLANALRDTLRVDKGDRFAVMALNSHRYLELYHAGVPRVGAVVNPLNLRLAPKELALHPRGLGEPTSCSSTRSFAGADRRSPRQRSRSTPSSWSATATCRTTSATRT